MREEMAAFGSAGGEAEIPPETKEAGVDLKIRSCGGKFYRVFGFALLPVKRIAVERTPRR